MNNHPTRLLIGISGFLETEKRPSGIEDILWEVFAHVEGVVCCRFLWNDSRVTMRRQINRIVELWPDIKPSILGYSYGGTTACGLADDLRPDQITIENLFLIDPVWRPFKKLPSCFSIMGVGTLWAEPNVDRVYVWRQRQSVVRGCKVKRRDVRTTLTEDLLNYPHTRIDNSGLIQAQILARLKNETRT